MRLSKVVVPILAAALHLGSAPAFAQQPMNDQLRATARTLGEEGIKLFEEGRYSEALDRFERADALVHAPTLGLLAARTLEKLGRLIEASERYRAVMLVQLDAKAPEPFKEAQETASKELEAVRARIPTLEIVVEGPGAEAAKVTLDGNEVPRAIIGVKTPVDPGVHRLEAETPTAAAVSDLSIDEKQAARAVLTLVPKEPAPGDKQPVVGPKPKPSTQRTIGFVTLGVGGGLAVMGIAAGITGLVKEGELVDKYGCKDDACPPSAKDALASYTTARTLSIVGYVAGGIGIGTGLALVLTAPKAPARTNKAHIEPWLGIGSAGLRGTF